MNKFVLGIFVILAIGMADLPSTLACSPDILHQLTTITTQSPSNINPPAPAPNPGVVYSRPVVASGGPIVHGIPQPAHPSTIDSIVDAVSVPEQPRSVVAGSNVFELEMEGFSICNTDGTEGLTFDELSACRVIYNSKLVAVHDYYSKPNVLNIFWIFRTVWGTLWFILGPQLLNLTMLMTTKMET